MPTPRPTGLDAPWVPTVLRRVSKLNVALYRWSGGRLGGRWYVGSAFRKGGVPVCLLTTVGRKSGQPRTAPLLYLRDGDNVVVVASQGGLPRNPLWYLNLQSQPDAELQIGPNRWPVRARTAGAQERDSLWPRLVELYPDFDNYAEWTERTIPVVVLEPR